MRAGLIQLNVGDDPAVNLPGDAEPYPPRGRGGAGFVLTPECTNALSGNRAHQRAVLRHEDQDATLAALRDEAARAGIWLLVGSLGVLTHDADGRFAQPVVPDWPHGRHRRPLRQDPHVRRQRVRDRGLPGKHRLTGRATRRCWLMTGFAKIGMTVCYDVRFPHLFAANRAQAGAQILTVPAAFNHITGAAHWEVLLRARAIETGCFVLAPAQTGFHGGNRRQRAAHLWPFAGDRALGARCWPMPGPNPGVTLVDLDLGRKSPKPARACPA